MAKPVYRIGIMGAGLIGTYVGARLVLGGANLVLVGRETWRERLSHTGLKLSDLKGWSAQLPFERIEYATETSALADCDLIILTVKSAATVNAAHAMIGFLKPGVVILSLQNGVGNAERLKAELPGITVFAGMVPYNVAEPNQGHFHQGTQGAITFGTDRALDPLARHMRLCGLKPKRAADMEAVLWSKLILNLNNAVNALSRLPLKAQLSDRNYRRCLALAQDEGLALLKQEGRIRPAKITAVSPGLIPFVLRLPDPLFKRLAGAMLAMDDQARSSMLEDIEAGRTPEIDWINGEVVRLAQRLGKTAPVNAKLCQRIEAMSFGRLPEGIRGHDLLAELKSGR